MAYYNKEDFVRELLDLYQSLPCLWRIKSTEYSDRIKKQAAYAQLVDLFKKHSGGEAVDVKVVKKKIQGLRTVYKKEANKVDKSKKSGAGTDQVYVSPLWYFNLLEFTRDQELPRMMESSYQRNVDLEADIENDDIPIDDNTSAVVDNPQTDMVRPQLNENPTTSSEPIVEDNEAPAPSGEMRRRQLRKKKANTPVTSAEFYSLATQLLSQPKSTPVDSFAAFASDRLCKLDSTQREQAERLMLEVLRKAGRGELDDNDTICKKNQSHDSNTWIPRQPLQSTPNRMHPPRLQLDHPPQYPPPQFPPPHYPRYSNDSFLSQLSSPTRPEYVHQYEDGH
ncbi:uncharacterized protein ACNLHF_024117 [Anomaloglossus baeobatrachus]|uniref:uncharacterized protein LOC142244208 n=1 Tax=Anomaloglossus baeobatrachus TaxID=238106 RepID=UPI003F4FEE36